MKNPEMTLYKGPMGAGKTTRLIQHIKEYRHSGLNVLIFKPKKDRRNIPEGAQNNLIVTHDGISIDDAIPIKNGNDIINYVDNKNYVDVIAVDEQFMIQSSGSALVELFKFGINVIVSTVDISFAGNPFNEVREIMPWCTNIVSCKSFCVICHKYEAYYTHKNSSAAEEIEIGGLDIYEPRCWNCSTDCINHTK